MKTFILFALGLLLFTGCCTRAPYFSSKTADEITVQLKGTPGLNVCGSYYIDGVEQTVHGQIPMNISVVGGDFHCDFVKTGHGDLSLILSHNCRLDGKATAVSSAPGVGGVKARLEDGDAHRLTSITGY